MIKIDSHVRVRLTNRDDTPHPMAGRRGTVIEIFHLFPPSRAAVRLDREGQVAGYIVVLLDCLEEIP